MMMVLLAAAPVFFKKNLESKEATEGDKATLSCETSSPDCKVTWWKGSTLLTSGEKYTMEHRATTHTLIIHKINMEDPGEYMCDTGDKKSTATVTVKGKNKSVSCPIPGLPMVDFQFSFPVLKCKINLNHVF